MHVPFGVLLPPRLRFREGPSHSPSRTTCALSPVCSGSPTCTLPVRVRVAACAFAPVYPCLSFYMWPVACGRAMACVL
eukprot:6212557-Pleurochrysis_carterae.AAC.2